MRMEWDLDALVQALLPLGVTLERDVRFSALGSFQLGGPVRALVRVTSPTMLSRVRKVLHKLEVPVLLMGEGTNLLFSDEGWSGCMVRYADDGGMPVEEVPGIWNVSAAMGLDELSRWAADQGLSGLEPFTGIPGTVGGAVVGNAGAWGVQMEHVLRSVEVITPHGEVETRSVDQCGFRYRDSALKHGPDWVVSVTVKLEPEEPQVLHQERERILAERAARHPEWQTTPCIGSFFRNLEPTSKAGRRQAAGWFLESAGAKSLQVGGAGVFEKHANIPIKRSEECTAADVAELARQMQAAVAEAHGIHLIREVRYLGSFPGESEHAGWF